MPTCEIKVDEDCKVDVADLLNFTDIKDKIKVFWEDTKDENNNVIPIDDKIATAVKKIRDEDLKVAKEFLANEWQAQRLTPSEYANAVIQVLPQVANAASTNYMALERLKDEKIKFILEEKALEVKLIDALLGAKLTEQKVKESKQRTKLYEAQAKGYKDKTKIDAVAMLKNIWITMYSQNQIRDPLKSVGSKELNATIVELFATLGMGDPSDELSTIPTPKAD